MKEEAEVSGGAAIPSPFESSKITPLSPSLPPPITSSPFAAKDVAVSAKTSMDAVRKRLRCLNREICIGAKE